eukprot:7292038-Heterocapsa_arctica.AAC.1
MAAFRSGVNAAEGEEVKPALPGRRVSTLPVAITARWRLQEVLEPGAGQGTDEHVASEGATRRPCVVRAEVAHEQGAPDGVDNG